GPESCLYSAGFYAGQFNPVSISIPQEKMEVSARIRYNAPQTPARLTVLKGGRVLVEFAAPQKSVTPGQSAVFYKGDVVLGGAIIDEPIALEEAKFEIRSTKLETNSNNKI
ncbi:MAG: hypothetical protein HY210_06665, partial [Candidatus Omnitrophica bacterium]|nr:hypothetical protein [Candidatus Omnitrophota bacterium]